jgi:predicted membrane channel-forming protein YqfA (hemolysin III family)
MEDYKPSWRKPVGMLLILAIVALWAIAIASFSEVIGGWPGWLQAIFYVVAGIVWIFPVRPLLTWMELGRFR